VGQCIGNPMRKSAPSSLLGLIHSIFPDSKTACERRVNKNIFKYV